MNNPFSTVQHTHSQLSWESIIRSTGPKVN